MPKIIENSSHIQSIVAICTKFLLHISHPLLQFHCDSQKGVGEEVWAGLQQLLKEGVRVQHARRTLLLWLWLIKIQFNTNQNSVSGFCFELWGGLRPSHLLLWVFPRDLSVLDCHRHKKSFIFLGSEGFSFFSSPSSSLATRSSLALWDLVPNGIKVQIWSQKVPILHASPKFRVFKVFLGIIEYIITILIQIFKYRFKIPFALNVVTTRFLKPFLLFVSFAAFLWK